MDQTIERRIAQVERETLLRLAAKAERGGVVIFYEPVEERHYATSRSEAFRLYRVSPDSCDCRGWRVLGRCGHNALLRSQLGLVEDVDPTPEPPPTVTLVVAPPVCAPCRGRGWVYATIDDDSMPIKQSCRRCAGAFDRWGHVPIEELAGDLNESGVFVLDAA